MPMLLLTMMTMTTPPEYAAALISMPSSFCASSSNRQKMQLQHERLAANTLPVEFDRAEVDASHDAGARHQPLKPAINSALLH
jgi:hypothetical protein